MEWEIKPLSEVFRIKPPKAEAKKNLSPDELVSFVPMNQLGVSAKHFESQEKKPLKKVSGSYTYFADGDVLLAKITPCFENGKLGIARDLCNGIGFGSSEYIVFRSLGQVESGFLYYYLARQSFRDEGASVMTGAVGHKRVPKEFIENCRIPVPPLAEQQRIVAILDEAFEDIAAAMAKADRNLKNVRELFGSYLQAVFGTQKAGWDVQKIGDVCTLKSGTTLPKSIEKGEGDIPYLKVADMNLEGNLNGVVTSSRFVNSSDVKASSLLPVGTTIFPKRGGAIATNKKRLSKVDICVDLNTMGVIPGCDVHPEFLFFYFKSVDMAKLGSGTSIPQINNYDIAPLLISFPRDKEQQYIVSKKLQELETEVVRLEAIYQQKLDTLDELKQSLLQKAFAGELH